MALKFLNKKGWHTGSLRNIENVWKAEQKHDAEQKKLEELRKQIQEERERSEFRLLQEQAGLVPRQERLDFLYDSGLAVGKGNSDGFKALESFPKTDPPAATSSSSSVRQQLGALFEEKPHSVNDAWRKLHSDPLLLIRQREQESLAYVKNNPVQMATIRKSVEAKKSKEKTSRSKGPREKRHHKKSKHHMDSSSVGGEERRNNSAHKISKNDEHSNRIDYTSGREQRDVQRKRNLDVYREQHASSLSDSTTENGESREGFKRNLEKSKREERHSHQASIHGSSNLASMHDVHRKRPYIPSKLSAEDRAARLKEMQMDAELHEENRWNRLKKADDIDMQEAMSAVISGSKNFLDAAKRSVYGAEKGGSSTIEESVRRRTHYLQSKSEVEGNAFRR